MNPMESAQEVLKLLILIQQSGCLQWGQSLRDVLGLLQWPLTASCPGLLGQKCTTLPCSLCELCCFPGSLSRVAHCLEKAVLACCQGQLWFGLSAASIYSSEGGSGTLRSEQWLNLSCSCHLRVLRGSPGKPTQEWAHGNWDSLAT